MTPGESSGVAVTYVPKRSIKLGTPRTSGPVRTCPRCKTAFRAESRRRATCPFCQYDLPAAKGR
jgi:uncharacterized paraquat-inducible protein A